MFQYCFVRNSFGIRQIFKKDDLHFFINLSNGFSCNRMVYMIADGKRTKQQTIYAFFKIILQLINNFPFIRLKRFVLKYITISEWRIKDIKVYNIDLGIKLLIVLNVFL